MAIAACQEYNNGTPQRVEHNNPPHTHTYTHSPSSVVWLIFPFPRKMKQAFFVLEQVPTKREIFLREQKPLLLAKRYKKQTSYIHFIPPSHTDKVIPESEISGHPAAKTQRNTRWELSSLRAGESTAK